MAHFDLAIIGTGSGNALVTPDFDGKRVAIVEAGTFGGTCLNVGCIPTKMYVYAADVANTVTHAATFGIDATLDGVRWRDIRDRVFGRIDPIAAGGRDYRVNGPNTTAFLGHASFIGARRLRIDTGDDSGVEITADQIVIAAGAHPTVPDAVAQSGVPFHTSDTVMRLDELPKRLVILGSGFSGAEFAHVFSALGSQVTVVARSGGLLRKLGAEISARFTAIARQQWDVRLDAKLTRVSGDAAQVCLDLADGSQVIGDVLLVATGRVPNTVNLGLELAGIATHRDGRVTVDAHGRTNVEGVWALGDVSSAHQLKHVANHEARVVAHNLTHPGDLRSFDHRYVPLAVFTSPQIASVGLTQEQLTTRGRRYVTKTQAYGDTAYGWAMEDTTGVCTVIADPATGELLGAHLMGHQASILIQPLIQGMSLGQTVTEMAHGQYWIHPALCEVVENALLGLELDPH
ncbi:MAG: mycothione reductase [Dermatophilaceae bacterium]|nr:mycothione reductase [Dermatophilaceae bacterium]